MSSQLGRQMSVRENASRMMPRARASDQSRNRRFVSSDTFAPALRACSIAASPASQALVLIARLIPERCRKRACAMVASGNCSW